MHFYYLFIDLFCIAGPLFLSFDKRVSYYKNWIPAFVAILFTCLLFIPFDYYFTESGYWGFNEQYLIQKWIFGLPVEEVLFFVAVPFACIFIYECVIYYFPKTLDKLDKKLSWIHLAIFNVATIIFALLYFDRIYSFSVAIASLLVINFLSIVFRRYMARCIFSFSFILIPFLLINGALTGSFTANEVVWYNETSISGIRIGTIPLEDIYYNILLVACAFFFYLVSKRIVQKR